MCREKLGRLNGEMVASAPLSMSGVFLLSAATNHLAGRKEVGMLGVAHLSAHFSFHYNP
jgi:hypothetical protein